MINADRTIRAVSGILLGIGIVAAGSSVASASESNQQDPELRASFLAQGVSPQQADGLMEKIQSDMPLDVFNPEIESISTEEYVEDGFNVVDVRYPDGSYSISRSEIAVPVSEDSDGLSTLGVEGCSESTSGSWIVHTNCLATWDVPLGNFQHHVDYRWISGGQGAGQIDQVWGAQGGGVGYQAGTASVSIVKANGNPAVSSARASFADPVGGIAVDLVGDLWVDSGGAWTQPAS